MRRTETPLLVITGVLFLAMLGWLGLSVWQTLSDPIRSTLAVPVTMEESVALEGLILREETVLQTDRAYYTLTAPEGRRTAAGAALGYACDGAAELRRARLLTAAENAGAGDSTLAESVQRFSAALARRDLAAAGAENLVLTELAGLPGGSLLLSADTALLEYRLSGRAEELQAPVSGLFSARLDGYERLSPAMLAGLTVSDLADLLAEPSLAPTGAYGRIVTGRDWYFAAWAEETDGAALRAGETVTLSLDRLGLDMDAVICSVSNPEDGRCAVVLRASTALRETLSTRFVRGRAVTNRLEGLQLPREAVRHDEAGDFVFRAAGLMAERVAVTVLYEKDGLVLISGDGLRAGNEILLGGSDLYDGRLLT